MDDGEAARARTRLFWLAPLVGEFLLGNVSIGQFGFILLMAPLYGGGALLIREVARRAGGGWPMILLLGAAYAIVEEGPVDQMLWNPTYVGHHMLVGDSYLPALGTSVSLVQAVLALHAVWSTSVPIALVESLVPERRTEPWLRVPGLVVTAVIFLGGCLFVCYGNYTEEHFMATPAQFGTGFAAIAVFVFAAWMTRRRSAVRPPVPPQAAGPATRRAPGPWLVGALAFVVSSGYLGSDTLLPDVWPSEWFTVALWFILVAVVLVPVLRWSRRAGWGPRHRLALAAGALFT